MKIVGHYFYSKIERTLISHVMTNVSKEIWNFDYFKRKQYCEKIEQAEKHLKSETRQHDIGKLCYYKHVNNHRSVGNESIKIIVT